MLLLLRCLASEYVLTTHAMRAHIHIAFIRIQLVICIMGCSTGCYIGYNFLLVLAAFGVALEDTYKVTVYVAFGVQFGIIYTRYQKAGIIFYTSGAWALKCNSRNCTLFRNDFVCARIVQNTASF